MNFEEARILAIFEAKTGPSQGYIMIAEGKKLRSSIIVLDSLLNQISANENLDSVEVSQVSDTMFDGRYIFALDSYQNLIAIDTKLIQSGVTPYQVIKFEKRFDKVLSIDQQHIQLLHASGMVQKIERDCFSGKVQLEESGGDNNYLVWQ